jgi:hypothetical protein
MPTITTPRPPLNIFDRARLNLTSSYQTVYETPDYLIPATGPTPARTIEAVALLTSLIVTNTDNETIEISLRAERGGNTWMILDKLLIPENDFALIDLGKQNFVSGDALQAKLEAGQTGVAHLSFVLNQREEYTVIP